MSDMKNIKSALLLILIFIITKGATYLLLGQHAVLTIPGWHTRIKSINWISNLVGILSIAAVVIFIGLYLLLVNDKMNNY